MLQWHKPKLQRLHEKTGEDMMNDDYGKRALDFVEDMQKLVDREAIVARIIAELEWFGFTHVTIADMPGPGEDARSGVLINTRPPDYTDHYARSNLIVKDPVILMLQKQLDPFSWSDVKDRSLSKTAIRIMDEGREFDARDGLVIPIVTASGSMSIFSPCGRDPNLSPRARSALDMIGIYSHQALQRASVRQARRLKPPEPLTAREREIMTWVAAGKSDDEIASILNVARETVTKHLANSKQKLDATRRTFAVVQALRYGEITL